MGHGYYTVTRVTDFGPYITKLVLPVPGSIREGEVKASDFSVYVERMDAKGEVLILPKTWMAIDDREPSRGYIPVRKAYPSTQDGTEQKEGEFVTLEMAYGPSHSLSAAISAINNLNVYINSQYRIIQLSDITTSEGSVSGLVFNYSMGNFSPDSRGFLQAASEAGNLKYGYYIPQMKGNSHPLLIWLHGGGEGGEDPAIAYTGNKVTALITPEIQKLFQGAYVLVPQSPTFWMDDGSGTYGDSGTTIYTQRLKALIDEFIEYNPSIDTDCIYIGGCSNGGFMTMKMILEYPDFFAAAYPVCEGLYDKRITEEQIRSVCHLPIWFVHAQNDTILRPEETAIPTYERLLAAGAQRIHFTYWEQVTDIHEGFKDLKGNPFEYLGHFVWIPLFNRDCRLDFNGEPVCLNREETELFAWLAQQRKR